MFDRVPAVDDVKRAVRLFKILQPEMPRIQSVALSDRNRIFSKVDPNNLVTRIAGRSQTRALTTTNLELTARWRHRTHSL